MSMRHLLIGINDESLKEELETCTHFLVHSEMEIGRHRVFHFAMNILDAQTLSQKRDTVFNRQKCAAQLNVPFGFVLKNVEDGTYWYYYAHESNILKEGSKLVATEGYLQKIKKVLSGTNVTEACTKERANTKWKFFNLVNLIVFAALFEEVAMDYKDAV